MKPFFLTGCLLVSLLLAGCQGSGRTVTLQLNKMNAEAENTDRILPLRCLLSVINAHQPITWACASIKEEKKPILTSWMAMSLPTSRARFLTS